MAESKVQKVARGSRKEIKKLPPCIKCGGEVVWAQVHAGRPRMANVCMGCGNVVYRFA